ncbi:hypothetical protein T484DRAFT_1777491 [Baffinella frigidus]|nr:hypothetical protein T484DRAFT_1777491 [Cryptophyta sp. CCMP2293]
MAAVEAESRAEELAALLATLLPIVSTSPVEFFRLNLWDTVPESWRAELLAVDDEDLPALSTGELTLRCEEPAPAAGSCPNPPSPRLDRA